MTAIVHHHQDDRGDQNVLTASSFFLPMVDQLFGVQPSSSEEIQCWEKKGQKPGNRKINSWACRNLSWWHMVCGIHGQRRFWRERNAHFSPEMTPNRFQCCVVYPSLVCEWYHQKYSERLPPSFVVIFSSSCPNENFPQNEPVPKKEALQEEAHYDQEVSPICPKVLGPQKKVAPKHVCVEAQPFLARKMVGSVYVCVWNMLASLTFSRGQKKLLLSLGPRFAATNWPPVTCGFLWGRPLGRQNGLRQQDGRNGQGKNDGQLLPPPLLLDDYWGRKRPHLGKHFSGVGERDEVTTWWVEQLQQGYQIKQPYLWFKGTECLIFVDSVA